MKIFHIQWQKKEEKKICRSAAHVMADHRRSLLTVDLSWMDELYLWTLQKYLLNMCKLMRWWWFTSANIIIIFVSAEFNNWRQLRRL